MPAPVAVALGAAGKLIASGDFDAYWRYHLRCGKFRCADGLAVAQSS